MANNAYDTVGWALEGHLALKTPKKLDSNKSISMFVFWWELAATSSLELFCHL